MVRVLIQVVNFKKSLGTINMYGSQTQKHCLTTDNVDIKKNKRFINSAIQFNNNLVRNLV